MRPTSVVDSGGVSRAESPAVGLRDFVQQCQCLSVEDSVQGSTGWRRAKKGMRAGISSTDWNPNGPALREVH
jgi:hypothetical protein